MEDFTHTWELEKPAEQARRDMGTNLPPRLSHWGYRMLSQDDSIMAFERTYFPWYSIVLAVILFPIGLLFLLLRRHASLVFTIEPGGKSCKVTANGRATPQLRNGLVRSYPPDASRPVDAKAGPAM